MATLLPGSQMGADQPNAHGRRLIDAGASIALASRVDPGTPEMAMTVVVALGVPYCGITLAEAIHAGTVGGARALRRTDIGTLNVGALADLHVLNAPTHGDLAGHPGMTLTHSVYRQGNPCGNRASVDPERATPITAVGPPH